MAASLVQSQSGTASGASTLTITLGSNTTAGNCLVVYAVITHNTSGAFTVSGITIGGSADNFAKAKGDSLSSSTGSPDAEIWTDQDCVGGQTSVVITASSTATAILAWVEEWSGIVHSGAVDKTNADASAGTTAWTSLASGTLTQAAEVAVGVAGFYNSTIMNVFGPGSPWTNESVLNVSNQNYLISGYQVTSATGSLTYNGTTSKATNFAAAIVTLLATTNVSVAISAAVVQVAAEAVSWAAGPVPIGTAVVQVAAQPLTPIQGPPIAAAVVQVAAQQLAVHTGLAIAAAVIKVAAQAVTPTVTTPKLILSIAPVGGTDTYGYKYVAGHATYGTGFAGSMDAGYVQFYTGSLSAGWTASASVTTNSLGDILLQASSGRQVITDNNTLDDGSGNATIGGDLTVSTINGSAVTGGPNGTGFFDTTGLASGSYGSTHQHTLPSFPTSTHTHNI